MKTPLFKNCCKMMSICMLFFFTNFAGYSQCPTINSVSQTSCQNGQVCYSISVSGPSVYSFTSKYEKNGNVVLSGAEQSGSGNSSYSICEVTDGTYDNITFWAYVGSMGECTQSDGLGCCSDRATGPLPDCGGGSGGCNTGLSISNTSANPSTICSGETSSLSASATGGTGSYSFSWSNGSSVTSPGTYGVTVTDADGCEATGSVTVGQSSNCGGGGSCSISGSAFVTDCDDNNTSDPSDDTFYVTVGASGSGQGNCYNISGSGMAGGLTISDDATFGPFGPNQNLNFTVTHCAGCSDGGISITTPSVADGSCSGGGGGGGVTCDYNWTFGILDSYCETISGVEAYCFLVRGDVTGASCNTYSISPPGQPINPGDQTNITIGVAYDLCIVASSFSPVSNNVGFCATTACGVQTRWDAPNCGGGTGGGSCPYDVNITNVVCSSTGYTFDLEVTTTDPEIIAAGGLASWSASDGTELLASGAFGSTQTVTVSDLDVTSFTITQSVITRINVIECLGSLSVDPSTDCGTGVSCADVVITTTCAENNEDYTICMTVEDLTGNANYWFPTGDISGDGTVYNFGVEQCFAISGLGDTDFDIVLSEGMEPRTNTEIVVCTASQLVSAPVGCGVINPACDFTTEITEVCTETGYDVCITVTNNGTLASSWYVKGDIGSGSPDEIYEFKTEECYSVIGYNDINYDIILNKDNDDGSPCFEANTSSAPVGCGVVDPCAGFIAEITSVSNTICVPVREPLTLNAVGTAGSEPYTYEWSNGPTTELINITTPGEYVVTITDSKDCTATASVTITGEECTDPCADFAGEITTDIATICPDGSETATLSTIISGGTSPYTYSWDTGANTSSIMVNEPDTYLLTVTDASGDCILELSFFQAGKKECADPCETLTGVIIPSVSPVCDDKSITATLSPNISGGTPPYTYMWSNGAMTETIDVTSGGTYSLVVTDASDNCVLNMLYFLNEEVCTQPCSIAATSRSGSCENYGTPDETDDEYTAQINIASNAPCYVIKDSNGVTVASGTLPETANVTIPADGVTQETFTIESCEDSNCSSTITIGPVSPCSAGVCELSADAGPGIDLCNGQMGSLNASGMGGTEPYSYNWDNGLGSGASQTVSCTTDGRTFYTVTVSDANGCTATDIVEVVCVVGESSISTSFYELTCTRSSIELTANPSTGYTYEWFLDGSSVGIGSTYTATSPGDYTLVTTIEGKVPCQTTSDVLTIIADIIAPVIAISNDGPLTCEQGIVTVTADAQGSYQYAWEGPGGLTSNQPSFNTAMGGEYCVTVTNPRNGCETTACTTVEEETDMPSVDCGGPYALTCLNSSVVICPSNGILTTGDMDDGYSYQWIGPGGVSGAERCIPATVPGTYTVIVTDDTNGCSTSCNAMVVNNTLEPNADASNNGPITCANPTVEVCGDFQVLEGTEVIYGWFRCEDVPDNIIPACNGKSCTYTLGSLSDQLCFDVTEAGDYCFVVIDVTNGCTATANTTVEENTTEPEAEVYNNGPITCDKLIVEVCAEFEADAGNQVSYSWANCSTPDQFISNQRCFDVALPGDYCVVVTDLNNGCTATASTTVVEDTEAPEVVLNAQTTVVNCNFDPISVSISPFDLANNDYIWENGCGLTIANNTGSINVDQACTLGVTVINKSNGCRTTETITITEEECGKIGDYVWHDLNYNGLQDVGEPAMEGVTVQLKDASFNVLETTTTSAAGFYQFDELSAADYYVMVIPPSGYGYTLQDAGADVLDSDIDPTTGNSSLITLAGGQTIDDIDVGLFKPAAIGDLVWADANGNGLQDVGEQGIAGVSVSITYPDGSPVLDIFGNTINSMLTNSAGGYVFNNLPAGDFKLTIDVPTGYAISPSNVDGSAGTQAGDSEIDNDFDEDMAMSHVISVECGDEVFNVDAGLYQTLSLGNQVWSDANNNGQIDAGENGIGGVVMILLDGFGNPVLDAAGNPITTTTDVNGNYVFTGLAPGDYQVKVDPSNFAPGGPLDGLTNSTGNDPVSDPDDDADNDDNGFDMGGMIVSDIITLTSGGEPTDDGDADPNTNMTVDFGFLGLAELGDYVWLDSNVNGFQDGTEAGINGVTVNLYEDVNGDGIPDGPAIGTTTTGVNPTTGADGYYQFGGLNPGDYIVEFIAPTGYFPSPQNSSPDGSDSDADETTGLSQTVTINTGDSNQTIDAGYYEENKIGNFVWEELGDAPDGVFDSSIESGFEGIIVELYELVGGVQVFVGSTTTDGSGNYLFDNLPAGNYQVKFNAPSGFEFTQTNAGTDDTIDSDVNPGGFTVQTYSLSSGTCDETADAGLTVMLPIELLSFEAEYNGDEVEVTWETASEINNDYFEVERSTDGSDYEVIADVDGAGNSTTVQSYGINDTDVESGTYYYRLKQVDFDGSYSYSEVRSVVIEQAASKADLTMSVYPNPARDFVTIDINAQGQEVEMRLYAADGKLMSNVHYDTAIDTDMTSIRLDASALPRGVYVARVLVGHQSITKKLFIIE